MASEPQHLVASFPAETWAILTALIAGLAMLVGVLYRRLNKDIAQQSTQQEKLDDNLNERIDTLSEEFHRQCDKVTGDLNGIGREVSKVNMQIAQFSTTSVFQSQEIDKLQGVLKDINLRLARIEVEHLHCMKLHTSILSNGGHNHRS